MEPVRSYHIVVKESVHPRWSEWFENMTISPEPDGTTILHGTLQDRAALYGLLNKLRDMGLTLLIVEVVADNEL